MAVKVPRLLKIDPPIQAKNFLSAGYVTLSFVPAGTKVPSYFDNLCPVPGNVVEPPLKTMLEYKSFLTSRSHFIIDWYTISCKAGI